MNTEAAANAMRFRVVHGELFAGDVANFNELSRDIGSGYAMRQTKIYEKKQPGIENLRRDLFKQRWQPLDAGKLKHLTNPGVYMIAWTKKKLEGQPVKPGDIFYIGMSNAAQGVRGRLKQFARGIRGKHDHSGAIRFYKNYGQNWEKSGKRFYVVALTLECESKKALCKPQDMIMMGHVTCLECYALAYVHQCNGYFPELNKLSSLQASKVDLISVPH